MKNLSFNRGTSLFAIVFGLFLPMILLAQGSSTGAAKKYDSRRTSGIVDKKAAPVFMNVAKGSGIDGFECVSGGKEKEYIIETTTCVVAVLDYNGDGLQDIYLLNGSTLDKYKKDQSGSPSALFKNLGDFKFENVTEAAGVSNDRWGMGVAAGDYNNDGFTDLFVSNYGVSRLYKNDGKGKFVDVAKEVGLDLKGWYTGASFGDFDKDGLLDLFVPSYLEFDTEDLPPSPLAVDKSKRGNNFCQFRGEPVMCGPRGLRGGKDLLFRQTKDGKFEDVGAKLGVDDPDKYYGFSSVFVDIDDDRDLDILVVNDSTAKQLYINNNGKFEEFGYPSGIGLNENGREQAGMGLGVGDFNNDLKVDFHITNFSDDSNTLYQNDGDANFTDITFQSGIGEGSIPFLGWGTSFLDYDNDGWKDLIVANGHVYPVVDKFEWGTSFAQQTLLFRNSGLDKKGRVRFSQIGAAPGSALAESFVARGLAVADFDLDGKLDVVMNVLDGPPALLKNVDSTKNNWLRIKLEGDSNVPKDAIGAVVIIGIGDKKQRFDVVSGAGYASQNEQVVHFGIGSASKIDTVTVIWPDNKKSVRKNIAPNKLLLIKKE